MEVTFAAEAVVTMMGMDQQFVAASARVAVAEISGEAVLLDLVSGQYYGLNEVGARIWHLLQEPRSLAEVVEALSAEYDEVGEEVLANDAARFIGELAERSLAESPNGAMRTGQAN